MSKIEHLKSLIEKINRTFKIINRKDTEKEDKKASKISIRLFLHCPLFLSFLITTISCLLGNNFLPSFLIPTMIYLFYRKIKKKAT